MEDRVIHQDDFTELVAIPCDPQDLLKLTDVDRRLLEIVRAAGARRMCIKMRARAILDALEKKEVHHERVQQD